MCLLEQNMKLNIPNKNYWFIKSPFIKLLFVLLLLLLFYIFNDQNDMKILCFKKPEVQLILAYFEFKKFFNFLNNEINLSNIK